MKLPKKINKNLFSILILITIAGVGAFLFTRFTTSPDLQQTDSLFSFNEGYGSTAPDTNSTVSAGTITNAVWKQSDLCRTSNCLYFDGTGDYVSYAHNAALDMAASDTVTIEAWFRTPDITSGTRTLISKEEATGADGGYRIQMNSSGQIVFGIDSNNTSYPEHGITSASAYDNNIWHHVAAVKNGTSTMSLYIDAILVGSKNIASTAADNNDPFIIGSYFDISASNGWSGFIDEVKVLRTARTATEIKGDFVGETSSRGTSASFGPDQSWISNGLVGYWPMDEAALNGCSGGQDSCDKSGTGNHGTWDVSMDTGDIVAGKYGNAVNMDDTANRVEGGDTYDLTSTDDLTISVWVYPADFTTTNAIMAKKRSTASTDEGWELYSSSGTGKINFLVHDNDGTPDEFKLEYTGLTVTQWNHVVMVIDRDSVSNTQLYLNGRKVEATVTGSILNINNMNHSANFSIGAESGTNDTNYSGKIDETRVYNRPLSPSEVQKLYSWAPGPLIDISFDNYSGSTYYDRSGNNHNASMQDLATAGTCNDFIFRTDTLDKWVKIHDSIESSTEVVQDQPTRLITYTKGVDYDMDYANGSIKILTGGSMAVDTYYYTNSTCTNTGPKVVSGKYGNALDFDGADDSLMVDSASDLAFNPNTTTTLMAWVYVDSSTNELNSNTGGILSHNYLNPKIQWDDSSFSMWVRFDETDSHVHTTADYPPGSWYHVAGTWDGTYIKIYVNGALVATSADLSGYTEQTRQSDWYIGRTQLGAGRYLLNGKLDEVKYYNYVRTPAQIVSDMNAGHPAPGSPVGSAVAHWKFNEGNGSVAHDAVSTNNLALNTNLSSWTKSGKFDSALDFESTNGSDVYVSDNAALSLTGSLTVSGFVKPESVTAATLFPIAGKATTSSYAYLLTQYGDEVRMYIGSSSNYVTTNAANLATGTWYSIIGVYDATTQTVQIYVNGILQASTVTGTIPASIADGTQEFVVGKNGRVTATVSEQITIDSDDGWDDASGTTYNSGTNSIPLRVGGKSTTYVNTTGLRFQTVAIPQGALIISALLDFQESWGGAYGTTMKTLIYGDDQDSCPTFVTTSSLPRDRTKTTAYKDWDSNGSQGTAGQWYQTNATVPPPDIATLVKEIVDRGSWASGNDMCILITDDGSTNDWWFETRSFADTECGLGLCAPKLTVSYESGHSYYDGVIDEVQVFSFALTADQVKLVNNQGMASSMGSVGTSALGVASSDAARGYCPPGNAEGNCAEGLDPVPVAEWKMDENTGTTANDTSGNGLTGSLGGGTPNYQPAWAAGKLGSALKFDGTNDVLSVNDNTLLEPANDMTVEFWLKLGQKASTKGSTMIPLAKKHDGTGGVWDSYYISISAPTYADRLLFSYFNSDGTEYQEISTTTIDANTWYHIVCQRSGSKLYIYINGKLENSNWNPTVTKTIFNSIDELNIGADWYGGSQTDGIIDDLRLYPYARTQSQVAWDYNRGGPVAWWKFNECSGSSAYDSSGNGYDLTLATGTAGGNNSLGSCRSEVSTEAWNNGTTGKQNASFDHDGTDSVGSKDFGERTVANFGSTDYAGTVTVWIKPDTFTGWSSGAGYVFSSGDDGSTNRIMGFGINPTTYTAYIWQENGDVEDAPVTDGIIQENVWTHIAWWSDGSTYKIYVNGVEQKLTMSSGSNTGDWFADTTARDKINTGILGWNSTYAYAFKGQIDDIRIFNYPLTPQQINLIMNNNSAVKF